MVDTLDGAAGLIRSAPRLRKGLAPLAGTPKQVELRFQLAKDMLEGVCGAYQNRPAPFQVL